jgi:transcription initiation factor TFIIE subunit alpha
MINEEERQTLLSMIEDTAGPEVRKVAILLMDQKDETTDELIAEELDVKLDEVRKALYKLLDLEIASFRRMRDKNTGWFIYFWKLHPERITEVVIKKQKAVHFKILERLQFEQENMFFSCGSKTCHRKTFAEAMELDFVCDKCDGRLMDFDNSKIIHVLKLKAEEIEEIIKEQEKFIQRKK